MIMLCASLLLAGAPPDTPIACNLNALSAVERQQHAARSERLKEAVVKVEEVADGYRLFFDPTLSPAELFAWIEAERRCCPFLDFELRLERENGMRQLQLTGREGVKAFIAEEIGAVRKLSGRPR
jgi:hypothetical protein